MHLLVDISFIYSFYVHMFGLGTELQFQKSKQVIQNEARQASSSTHSKTELSKLWAAVPVGHRGIVGVP